MKWLVSIPLWTQYSKVTLVKVTKIYGVGFYSVMALTIMILSGCQTNVIPGSEEKVCQKIWLNQDSETLANSSYWLKAVNCASELTPQQARQQAQSYSLTSWSTVLKHAILLSYTRPTSDERRDFMRQLQQYTAQFPHSVHPFLQLWQSNQATLLTLQNQQAWMKYTEGRLEVARQRELQLQKQLNGMYQKLSSLTAIEQQLSSRKLQNREFSTEQHPSSVSAATANKTLPAITSTPTRVSKSSVEEELKKPSATVAGSEWVREPSTISMNDQTNENVVAEIQNTPPILPSTEMNTLDKKIGVVQVPERIPSEPITGSTEKCLQSRSQ